MTDFLVIGGIPCLVLADNSASEQQREYGGSLRRAWDGSLRNTTRWRKRAWSFTVAPMVQADYAALDAVIALRQIVACSGAALGGAFNCAAVLQSGGFLAAHNETQSVPTFYSLTVGNGPTWNNALSARVAANFACSDGLALDLITDAAGGGAHYAQWFFSPVSTDSVIIRYRVARSGATIGGVSLYDSTAGVYRSFFKVDFTNAAPVVSRFTGADTDGQLLSVLNRGDGSYEITVRSSPLVPGNAGSLVAYPALVAAGSLNVGNVSMWDDISGTAGFRRTMALTLMEA